MDPGIRILLVYTHPEKSVVLLPQIELAVIALVVSHDTIGIREREGNEEA